MQNLWLSLKNNKPLFYAGLWHLCLFLFCIIMMQIDSRQLLGVSTWLKPSKFAFSGLLFLWSIAWILSYFKAYPRKVQFYAWFFALIFTLEVGVIALQGARGVTSHYNISSAFNIFIFVVMGVGVSLIVLGVFLLTIDTFLSKKLTAEQDILWAIRLGLIFLLLSSLEGTYMISLMSHSVGVKDGSEGLAYLNWSIVAGDLRIAHFIGMHALQALPIFVYFFRKNKTLEKHSVNLVMLSSFLIFAFMTFAFVQAFLGLPLL